MFCRITLVALVVFGSSMSQATPEDSLFTVFLDDKKIGEHRYQFSALENGYQVTSIATYDVKILGINFFKYRHKSVEHWRENCVVEIDSTTQENGDEFFVKSYTELNELFIENKEGIFTAPACLRTFGYWNKDLLLSSQLMNSQSGEILPITSSEKLLPNGQLQVSLVSVEKLNISLFYSSIGDHFQWQRLESLLPSKKVIRYERQ